MKKTLTRKNFKKLYYMNNDNVVNGANPNLRGNFSGLRGDCSELSGDLADCKITSEERERGINIADLADHYKD